MKKFGIALLGLAAAVCVGAGVGTAKTTVTNAEDAGVAFTKTVYKVSTDGQKMLLVTGMTNYSLVYEVGYEIDGYTVGEGDVADTTKYYDTITTGDKTEDATDIFGTDYEGYKLVVWEVAYTEDATFNVYALEGEMDGETLVVPEVEKKTEGTERTNTKYTVTFDTDGGNTIEAQEVFCGTPATALSAFVP
ncbi:MAG: hypothetical protein MJ072_06210, partial [Clostridia bacterium]|nr:hypothetical protein [Clostridia bacterium]